MTRLHRAVGGAMAVGTWGIFNLVRLGRLGDGLLRWLRLPARLSFEVGCINLVILLLFHGLLTALFAVWGALFVPASILIEVVKFVRRVCAEVVAFKGGRLANRAGVFLDLVSLGAVCRRRIWWALPSRRYTLRLVVLAGRFGMANCNAGGL